MAAGRIATSVLTDIANAIRQQNGTSTLYKPREMAAAVTALDGSSVGAPVTQPYKSLESGVLSSRVFDAIGDAIRGQNGESTTYAPCDMAAAILALSWDVGLKPRAVLLADGTLEFNYYDRRRSVTPGAIVGSFDVDPDGYASESERAYHGVRLSVTRVVIDSSWEGVGMTNAAYLFDGFQSCTEVQGFHHLAGITNAKQMFTSCKSLETIFSKYFDPSTIRDYASMFYGCNRLVGGLGFVPSATTGAGMCKVGGVLTDLSVDLREWIQAVLYDDGELALSLAGTAEPGRGVLARGRLCANAKYTAVAFQPWVDHRDSVTSVTFAPDMAGLSLTHMDYWFYSCTAITSVAGLGNIANVCEMKYTFCSCTGLTSLDFRGFDPGGLTSLFYTFSGRSGLAAIYADASWALPASGLTGMQCFYNCPSLVGGSGTTWDSSKTSYTYMVIDAAGTPGYLTALA